MQEMNAHLCRVSNNIAALLRARAESQNVGVILENLGPHLYSNQGYKSKCCFNV